MAGSPKHSDGKDGKRKVMVVRNCVVTAVLIIVAFAAYDVTIGVREVSDFMSPVPSSGRSKPPLVQTPGRAVQLTAPSTLPASPEGGAELRGAAPAVMPTVPVAEAPAPEEGSDGPQMVGARSFGPSSINVAGPEKAAPAPEEPAAAPKPAEAEVPTAAPTTPTYNLKPSTLRLARKRRPLIPALDASGGDDSFEMDLKAETEGCPNYLKRDSWDYKCTGMVNGQLYFTSALPENIGPVPTAEARRSKGPSVALLGQPKQQAHASTMCELDDGTILMAWFSGEEGEGNVVILVSRLEPGATKWTDPIIVSQDKTRSAQNPVLFKDPVINNTIHLYHTSQGAKKGQGDAYVARLHSTDGGLTWTPPKVLWNKGGPFVRNAFLVGKEGQWIVPMYYTPSGYGGFEKHRSTCKFSYDNGETWTRESRMTEAGEFLAQPTVVRLKSGVLKAFYRHRKAKKIYVATSEDDGLTWSKARPLRIPNNNSGIHAIVLPNGHIVLVFNNRVGKDRHPVSIAISEDDGHTWPYVRDVERGGDVDAAPQAPVFRGKKGRGKMWKYMKRYAYPWAFYGMDGKIHVSYSWRCGPPLVTIHCLGG
mmetsp:Transcript_63756/g.201646  ORF Transcript_63756/g.201646 Transcript_63756/m.201646 type:complete len:591 (-) Transcript_63756:33-1805(-)